MLLACAVLFPSALCGLLAAVAAGAPGVAVLGCAAVAGASFPPITVCMRTYLRQRMGDEAALVTAYSLDSVLIETLFIIGPLLVALFVALASPRAASGFDAGSGFIDVFLFLVSACEDGRRLHL